MARRSYRGNSLATTVSVGITSSSTGVTLTDASSFPTGTSPFVVTLDFGQAGEEKILATTRSGNILTGLTRGYDGTTATAHSAGATARHTLSATDLDEANAHVNANSAVHGVAGALVGTTDVQTLTNKTLTAPVVGDFTNATHTHTNAVTGGTLAPASSGAAILQSVAFSGPLVASTGGPGTWACTASLPTGASATFAIGPIHVTTLTAPSLANAACIAYPQNPVYARAFRRTYAEFVSHMIPFSATTSAGAFTQYGITSSGSVGADLSAAQDSAYFNINSATGAVTMGGRANSVSLTATPSSPPTLSALSLHACRIQMPTAGGTVNFFIDNVLVGTMPGMRNLITVGTLHAQHLLNSGPSASQGQCLQYQLAVADTDG